MFILKNVIKKIEMDYGANKYLQPEIIDYLLIFMQINAQQKWTKVRIS